MAPKLRAAESGRRLYAGLIQGAGAVLQRHDEFWMRYPREDVYVVNRVLAQSVDRMWTGSRTGGGG